MKTSIGNRGYSVLKSELDKSQIHLIEKQLNVKPYIPGSPVFINNTFPAYRESSQKYYLPRYFGEKHFGPPKEIKVAQGADIDLKFNGILRDYQSPVVEKYIKHVTQQETAAGLLELPCAWGKTSASLYILSQIKKKTIVIVHKEFLMNQWIERIQQFLPTARIGRIQGDIIDIEDKDIVLCMLKSLSIKDYDVSVFESFGFTIIDEVHHISSRTFSNALFKIVTKYMLGLSATMNRKDGTTSVFKMFLGEIIHKALRKDDYSVMVKAIEYKTKDKLFNETVYDYKGNPQISTMISKLCEYSHRTEFVIKVLNDFIRIDDVDEDEANDYKTVLDNNVTPCKICCKKDNYLMKNTCCDSVEYCLLCLENIEEEAKNNPEIRRNTKTGEEKMVKRRPKCPSCQKVLTYEQNYIENPYIKPISELHTIVLSHNLNVLDYIYRKFVCKNLASIGYYVGGMKEMELKKTEKKQIILASFQMAEEGLDVPTLTAEFLITPKTNIEQSVGRILRAKHATTKPIVYDIMDTHEVFQKQYAKRKSFYKKQGYKIIQTDSMQYQHDISDWKVVYEPSACKGGKNDSDSEDSENNALKTKNTIAIGKCLISL